MRLSPAMKNALIRMASGRPACSYPRTLEALIARQAVKLDQDRLVITPAGLAAIGRA